MSTPIAVPEVWAHIEKAFPSSTAFIQVAKCAEEAGEAVGAAIKQLEGRRTERDVRDELADTVIAAIAAFQARGADPAVEIAARWAQVQNRPHGGDSLGDAAPKPAPCEMKCGEPYDFAWCETHDTTFAVGDKCKFDGRELWEVYAEEADEQRRLKVRAELERDAALSNREQ